MRKYAILIVALGALACGAAFAAPAGYMQLQRSKYCGPLGDSDLDREIRGCEEAIATGLLSHDYLAGAWSNLAVAYIKKRDYDNAIRALGNAIAADPNRWYVYVNRGGIYDLQGKLDLAQADYDKAISLQPWAPPALRARGELYVSEKKYDLAVADLTAAIGYDGHDAKAYFYRALAFDGEGKADLAAADRAKYKSLDPNDELGLLHPRT